MLFSCKITAAVLTYLDRHGRDTSFIYEDAHLPHEFLRDPSHWLEDKILENFLNRTYLEHGDLEIKQEKFLEMVGHNAYKLETWGVLDSVLKMMQNPRDVFSQAQKFFSSFISPEPTIENFELQEGGVKFSMPIEIADYPNVVNYLRFALEGIPAYMGKPLFQVKWRGSQVEVVWNDQQSRLFSEDETGHVLSPDLMHSVISQLESSQRQLEERNRELLEKNQELERAKYELEKHLKEKIYLEKLSGVAELATALAHEINTPITYVNSNVMRLQDYFARAQQLIVLLIGQDRLTPQIQKAMKKVDWEWIQTQIPEIAHEATQGLWRVREIVRDLSFLANASSEADQNLIPSDLHAVIDGAIKLVSPNLSAKIRVEKHFLSNQTVPLYPRRMEQALVNLLNNAIVAVHDGGTICISTSVHSGWVRIEIADTGDGMDEQTLAQIFTPFYTTQRPGKGTGLGLSITQSIILMHQGKISVTSEKGKGATFIIELPLPT